MDSERMEPRGSTRPELADTPGVGSVDDIRVALARAVATRQVSDEAIAAVARRIAGTKLPVRGIDVCTYGICIDYFFNDDRWTRALPELLKAKGTRVHSVTVFPWGIPWPDIFRVRVEQEFDEFARAGVHG